VCYTAPHFEVQSSSLGPKNPDAHINEKHSMPEQSNVCADVMHEMKNFKYWPPIAKLYEGSCHEFCNPKSVCLFIAECIHCSPATSKCHQCPVAHPKNVLANGPLTHQQPSTQVVRFTYTDNPKVQYGQQWLRPLADQMHSQDPWRSLGPSV
jgi:hypothetical protein